MSTEQKPRFIRMDEGRIQRGNGSGGPSTSKPNIIPKPQRISAMTKPLSAILKERGNRYGKFSKLA